MSPAGLERIARATVAVLLEEIDAEDDVRLAAVERRAREALVVARREVVVARAKRFNQIKTLRLQVLRGGK